MFRTRKWMVFSTMLTLLALLLAACGSAPTTGSTTASGAAATSAAPSMAASASAASSEMASASATSSEMASASATSSEMASASAEATASVEASAAGGTSTVSGKLEIFSWWTNGGEANGLNAMFDIYKQRNPNVEVVNATVAGGAGTNAKAVLQTRLAGGQPPDSWQLHTGREALSYVNAGQMEPLTQFFKDQGFDKVMPKLLLEQLNINGEIYAVPVNIHRSNMLWYNSKVFQDNNLQPPKTLDEFFTVAEALKAKGITPLAVGGKDGFEASHLFESILLATFGPDDYTKLWSGDPTAWADERVATAIDTMARMLSYANNDRSARSWSEAAQLVLDGSAGMTIMGDWAHGYFISKGAKPNVDYGYVPSPGTDGNFMWVSDSFGLAKGAPNRDATLAWLSVVGSKEGQDAFNPQKGSIPARTDADRSKYDVYLQSSLDAFASNTLVGSAAHGAVTTNAYQQAFHEALEVFSSDPTDTAGVLSALTEAVADLTR